MPTCGICSNTITGPSTGCQTAGGSAYFCDYVTTILKNDPTFGEDEDTRMLNFRRGGYDVYTTLDLDLQIAAETTLRENVPQTYSGWDVGSVISSVQVGTGRGDLDLAATAVGLRSLRAIPTGRGAGVVF